MKIWIAIDSDDVNFAFEAQFPSLALHGFKLLFAIYTHTTQWEWDGQEGEHHHQGKNAVDPSGNLTHI